MMMMMMQQQQQQEEEQAPHVPQQPLMLPMGYKFLPTDRELLFLFLKNKLKDPDTFVPAAPIHDIKLYDHHPQIILAQFGVQRSNNNVECYVFTMRSRKYLGGKRPNRVLKDNVGYWRASYNHEDQFQEKRRGGGGLVGERMNFAFYDCRTGTTTSKKKKGMKTDWLMNEYRITSSDNDDGASTNGEDLVLCRVYLNNRPRNNRNNHQQQQKHAYLQQQQQQQPLAEQQYLEPYLEQQQQQQPLAEQQYLEPYLQPQQQQPLAEQPYLEPYLEQQQQQQPLAEQQYLKPYLQPQQQQPLAEQPYLEPYLQQQQEQQQQQQPAAANDSDTFWEKMSQAPEPQQTGAGISIDDYGEWIY